ncbi:MAG: hypothetical protein ATN31_08755 [Candidatus Epulonipiscioides saccharophilum]|nr:MAG: hypothetical protein ATN31_08755 [Epulopiscium sp. AS2M-Bin001]
MIKEERLAIKLAKIIGVIQSVVLIILILVVAIQVSHSSSEEVATQFQTTAELNAEKIQGVLDSAFSTLTDVRTYTDRTYENYSAPEIVEGKLSPANGWSSVLNEYLADDNYISERYILNTAWSAVANNTAIKSFGIYFEPYAFDPTQEVYAFEVYSDDAINSTSVALKNYSDYAEQEFYYTVLNDGKTHITDPFERDNKIIITISYPIMYQNQIKGVISVDVDVDVFKKTNITNSTYKTLFTTVIDANANIIYDSMDINNIGKNVYSFFEPESAQEWREKAATGEIFSLKTKTLDNVGYGKNAIQKRYLYPVSVGDIFWWAHVEVDVNEMNHSTVMLTITIIVISLISLILLISFVVWLLNKSLYPLNSLLNAADEISNGNLNLTIDIKSRDEIGQLGNTFTKMALTLKRIVQDIETVLAEMALGNFSATKNTQANYTGAFAPIKTSLHEIGDKLNYTLFNIAGAASEVSNGAEEISIGASELAEGTAEQSKIIQQFTASTDNIANLIKTSVENVTETSKISAEAKSKADKGTETMKNMLQSMQAINESSHTISIVLQTVESIASQTNLLALNAAIEAARAGDAGRGFAVVANEIRELANRSSETVKEIDAIIKTSINDVAKGQQMANYTAESLHEIVATIEQTRSLALILLNSANEQQLSIEALLSGTQKISNLIQSTSSTAEESAAVSEELAAQAQNLTSMLSFFKIEEAESL